MDSGSPSTPPTEPRHHLALRNALDRTRQESTSLRQHLAEARNAKKAAEQRETRQKERLEKVGLEKEELKQRLQQEEEERREAEHEFMQRILALEAQPEDARGHAQGEQEQEHVTPQAPTFCAMCAGEVGQSSVEQAPVGSISCGGWCGEWEEWRSKCRKLARRLASVERQLEEQGQEMEDQLAYMRLLPKKCGWCKEREEQLEAAERHREAVEREGRAVKSRPKGWLVHRVAELEVELATLVHRHGSVVAGEAEMRRRVVEALEMEGRRLKVPIRVLVAELEVMERLQVSE